MNMSRDFGIIFQQHDYEYEDEEYEERSDSSIATKRTLSDTETVEESIDKKKSESSTDIISPKFQDSPNIITRLCHKHANLNDIYNFYPLPKDTGIKKNFWTLYDNPPYYESNGVDKFFDVAKILGDVPLPSTRQQLISDTVDLGYCNANTEIIQALSVALVTNESVKTLNLQHNPLKEEACYYLNKLLMRNTTISKLNLSFCKIGVNGAKRLSEAMTLSSSLTDLILSHCELGSRGLRCVARSVADNTLLKSLDVSHNNLDEESADSLQTMLKFNDSLVRLDLSWNFFKSKIAGEKLFDGLTANDSLVDVDLSWNSMSRVCVNYLVKYIVASKTVKRLILKANRFTNDVAPKIGHALTLNESLEEFDISNNPFGSDGVTKFINKLSSLKFVYSPLLLLDLESYWAQKDVVPVLNQLNKTKPNLIIKLGGILENFEILGPDLKELFFKMANYEAMKPKKKKRRKNFGHFVLSLPDSNISKEDFMELVENSKIKVSENLLKQIMKEFSISKKSISQAALKESYKTYFPEVKLPKKRAPKEENVKEEKNEKKSESKNNKLPKKKNSP